MSGEYSGINVVTAFPSALHMPHGGEEIFSLMRGAKIVRIGAPDRGDFEGGGLVIDFIPSGNAQVRRAIFAFNDLSFWLEAEFPLPTPALAEE